MDVRKRRELLIEYAHGPTRVREFLAAVPRAAVTFRPFAEAWTMAEHVRHLLDAEINGYVRYRFAIAEPGKPAMAWNQEGWKEKLGYEHDELAASLDGFALMRRLIHSHLERIAGEDWSAYTFVHPERGTLDLDAWLETYTGHVKSHLEYLERNLRLFKEASA